MNQNRVVVTGASTGIGMAATRALTAAGWSVLATARRSSRLAELAQETGCDTITADLTEAVDVDAIVGAAGHPAALVNVAGGAIGLESVADAIVDDWQTMYDVNVLGTLRLTKALLPTLRKHACADILTVTSTAAQVAYEGGAGYCAAKAAERALVETLRLELCGEPVRVTQLAPGMVATEEFSLNRFKGDQEKADAVYAGVEQPLVAEDIADCIVWMLSRPAHVNIDLMTVRPVAQAAAHKVARH